MRLAECRGKEESSLRHRMNESENRQESEGGENKGRQVLRTEREWRNLLTRSERETARFLKFYEESFTVPEDALNGGDRLDHCALAMGWHLSAESAAAGEEEFSAETPEPEARSVEFPSVYSLHNLPESIAVAAICLFVRSRWKRLWDTPYAGKLSARAASTLAETLATAQRDMFLAIDAEDAMEFGLAICLMKNVHTALNRHFAEMECLPTAVNDPAYSNTVQELRCALMDLRDICLRILRDARAELSK